ncbi:hypothetical protein FJU08_03110 [Martelella alba]|uniref:Uncharacterized protein n=1 Tax=Martelella alba TaxID=2590451 RepID=A0A506UJS2_9HYPH|nr:hypothetical protein [Martelella alba]TPW33556.1 hypothetical protein FJU08_03110 [Martelella alba]
MKKILTAAVTAITLTFSPMAYAASPAAAPEKICGPQKPGQPANCVDKNGKQQAAKTPEKAPQKVIPAAKTPGKPVPVQPAQPVKK